MFNRLRKNRKENSYSDDHGFEGVDKDGNSIWKYGDPRKKRPEQFNSSKDNNLEFPVVYAFLTDKLKEKIDGPIALFNHGYKFYCRTPEQLEKYKLKYKKGEKYKDELITYADYKSEKDINT